MSFIFRVKTKIYRIISELFFRKYKVREFRNKITNHSFTIISSNCIGGIIYNTLGKKFLSPTINLSMEAESFIKFVENIEHYIDGELEYAGLATEDGDREQIKGYPIGKIKDITIHFVHYQNFEEAYEKWNERKTRINFDNLFVIMTDRDNCTDDIIERYSKISYPKVFYTNSKSLKYDFMCYVPGFENEIEVGLITRYADFLGNRYFEKYFDFVDWLNAGN